MDDKNENFSGTGGSTYCSSDALFLSLKYGGAAAVPPKVELNGKGRRPRNPSSIHLTSFM